MIAGLYFWTNVSRVLLFWSAFILTRPLGATVGDFLDKPVSQGGLAFSRPLASAVIAVVHYRLPIRAAAAGRATSRRIPRQNAGGGFWPRFLKNISTAVLL